MKECLLVFLLSFWLIPHGSYRKASSSWVFSSGRDQLSVSGLGLGLKSMFSLFICYHVICLIILFGAILFVVFMRLDWVASQHCDCLWHMLCTSVWAVCVRRSCKHQACRGCWLHCYTVQGQETGHFVSLSLLQQATKRACEPDCFSLVWGEGVFGRGWTDKAKVK